MFQAIRSVCNYVLTPVSSSSNKNQKHRRSRTHHLIPHSDLDEISPKSKCSSTAVTASHQLNDSTKHSTRTSKCTSVMKEEIPKNPLLSPTHKSRPSQVLSTIKYTDSNQAKNRLKSLSEPVFPKPRIQIPPPSTNTKSDQTSFTSPVDNDTHRFREELEQYPDDIYILEPKHANIITGATFPREALQYRCPTLFGDNATFTPCPFLASPHFQTTYVQIEKAVAPTISFERETVILQDGATIALDWFPKLPTPGQHHHDPTPILLLLHGLNGSSSESYIRTLTSAATTTRNYRVVAMNYRGCGNTPLTTPKAFDGAGGSDDLTAIITHIQTYRAHRAKLVLIGWSLGATMILNYLSTSTSKSNNVVGGIALSPTFDISQSIDLCSFQGGGVYSSAFALGLQVYLYQNWNVVREVVDARAAFQPTDLRDLADCLMGRLSGCINVGSVNGHSADGLFAEAALKLKGKIVEINVPTLILGSRDDPITKPHWAPLGEISRNPNVVFATTKYGGHMGWFEGNLRVSSWANRVALEWIDFILQP